MTRRMTDEARNGYQQSGRRKSSLADTLAGIPPTAFRLSPSDTAVAHRRATTSPILLGKIMNPVTFKLARTVCAASLTALTFASAVHAQTTAPTAAMPAMRKAEMQKGMMGSDGMQKMQMTGDTDKDFAMMMKIHHQQAVDMAQMELKDGKSPAMKKMAKQIISAQKKEIAMFDQWLAKAK